MPAIEPYENAVQPQQAPDIGAEAYNSAARRVGPLEHEAGEAIGAGLQSVGKAVGGVLQQREDDFADRQIMQGMVGAGKMHAAHLQQLNAIVNDPANQNNPDGAVNTFLQDTVAPEAENFVNSFTTVRGRKWAQETMGKYQASMTETGSQAASAVIGHAALINAHTSLVQLSDNAASDPSAVDQSVATWKSGMTAMLDNPRLSTEDRTKLEEFGTVGASQIAMAGVKGLTDRSPAQGLTLLKSYEGKGILTGEQVNALSEHADNRARVNAYDARIAQSNQDRADKQALNADINQLYARTIQPDGSIVVPTGPNGVLASLANLSETPGAKQDPSLIPNAFRYFQSVTEAQARGTPTVTNPAVFDDMSRRAGLDLSDPQKLTLSQVLAAKNQLSDKNTAELISWMNNKNPQFIQNEKQLNDFLSHAIAPADAYAMPPGNLYEFRQDRAARFHAGIAAGDSPADLLDPKSPKFIGGITDAELHDAAVGAVQQAAPYTAPQAAVSKAVDLAVTVAGDRNTNPDAVTDFLRAGGVKGVDASAPGGICAALVNSALTQAGIKGTGSQLASSFKTWGFEVAPAQVQKGDVFYVPAEGYTGHVGLATGRTRAEGGQLQIEVVSSHLQGKPDNPGGVEWRNAAGMMLRRAKPPVSQIMESSGPGMFSRIGSALSGAFNASSAAQPGMGEPPAQIPVGQEPVEEPPPNDEGEQ